MAVARTSTFLLGEFVAEIAADDIPDEVIDHVKLCLLDSVGCGIFGSTQPSVTIVRDALASIDDTRTSVVWGTGNRLSPAHAALVNGTAVHSFELDDLHSRSIVHAGSTVIPAAFAAADRGPVGGRAMLAAVALGYEVAARVGMTMGSDHLMRGWHPTGTHGALGAAAAAGRVLGLDAEQQANAIGTAGSLAAGLMASQYESMVKRLHAGRAAQSGYYSALFAENGYIGIADLFDAAYGGYGSTFSGAYDPAPLLDGLGSRWEVLNVGYKPYSCNGSCHPTVDILRELRAEVAAADVERVDVYVSSATKKHVGWDYEPGEVTTAQMNLPYIAAVTLTDGDAFVEQFSPARIVDPELVALSRRVQVHVDPEIDRRGDSARHSTRLRITGKDGAIHELTREFARGSARSPLPIEEVRDKYRRLAATVFAGPRVDEIERLIDRLDQLADVSELPTALASAVGAP